MFACQSYYQQDLYGENTHWVEHSFNDWQQFLAVLSQYQQAVRQIFNEIIGEEETQAGSDPVNEKLAEWKDILHYNISVEDLSAVLKDYPKVAENDYVEIFRHFSTTFQDWVKRPIGVRGREVLRNLMPRIADSIFKGEDHLLLLPRVLNIVDKITTRTTYLELMLEKEQILPHLLALCSKSVMIAEQIARYPMLLDELIGNRGLTDVLPFEQYQSALQDYLIRIPEEDEEALIDGLRQFKQTHILRIAAADILGVLPVMKISDHLTYLAEAIINAVVNMAWKSLTQRFGTPAHLEAGEQGFAVIGYGKLGGIELGYNSDLDLVFLHNAPDDGETVGGKKRFPATNFTSNSPKKLIRFLT